VGGVVVDWQAASAGGGAQLSGGLRGEGSLLFWALAGRAFRCGDGGG